jgi:hypothetical protein
MGRYVSFDTGLEYKFRFGIQQSEDVLIYGGKTSVEEEALFQTWTHNDNNSIMYILNNIEDAHHIDTMDFDKYEQRLEGTLLLRKHLRDIEKDFLDIETDYCRYTLGCLIYHQLQYKNPLVAQFEI